MIKSFNNIIKIGFIPLMAAIATGCGSGRDVSITKVKPPVQDAAGAGLTGSGFAEFQSNTARLFSVSTSEIKSRFFSGSGPTDVMNILSSVDGRLSDIESAASEDGDRGSCLDSAATGVALTVFGESITAKIQCYNSVSDGIIAFGKDGDTWWILDTVGAAITLAKATSVSGGVDVEVWGSVGKNNSSTTGWDGLSYGAYHLKGNTSTQTFEMTTGGVGIGFCGVSLKSDGTNLYVEGSAVGAGGTCATNDTACVLTDSLGSAGTCSDTSFELTKIGRSSSSASASTTSSVGVSTWDASPWGTLLTMDGSSTDAIHFATSNSLPSSIGKF